jgi:hypothetical protein
MNAKEKVFSQIDDLIDAGVNVARISKELPAREYDALRHQSKRAFGGYWDALREYGIESCAGRPLDVELYRCFEIAENYIVKETFDAKHIKSLYDLDDLAFRRLTEKHRRETEIDALDDFYREQFPFDHLPDGVLRRRFPQVYGYIRKHYVTYGAYLKAYRLSYEFALNRNYGGRRSIGSGLDFERKLAELLPCLYTEVKYHLKIGDCIPDFIVNGTQWIDAKLSAWTIYDTRSRTLEKYASHTDSLTVYYALGKRDPFTHRFARVLHVSTLYNALSRVGRRDLIEDMEAFISTLEPRKEDAA